MKKVLSETNFYISIDIGEKKDKTAISIFYKGKWISPKKYRKLLLKSKI